MRPISLALQGDLLYVLNEGGTPNITGFTVEDDGTLAPLTGSTRPLIGGVAADPAQIGFSQDGALLVVTEKNGNRLNTYTIDSNGLPSGVALAPRVSACQRRESCCRAMPLGNRSKHPVSPHSL